MGLRVGSWPGRPQFLGDLIPLLSLIFWVLDKPLRICHYPEV
jgi:hypothetical protein